MHKPIDKDLFGKALLDFQTSKLKKGYISTYSSIAGEDWMELSYLFRTFHEMPLIEQTALKNCYGSVLDIGCGSGSHTLHLQNKGFQTKAIDISENAIKACTLRGIKNAKKQNIWTLKNEKFDTILALMNGAGVCGTLDNLTSFLEHLKTLLNPNGQILLDSSDILYMYNDTLENIVLPENRNYYGEVVFEFMYKGMYSEKFNWLFINFTDLQFYAKKAGLKCTLIKEGFHHEFLVRMTSL